ncbi:MAG: hypothetical protein KBG20_19660 [Caldilineaceae bacterium]|nr:hypothetical protein [Caldilineaceae bacterium]
MTATAPLSPRAQSMTVLVLNSWAVVFLALLLFVRTLPATPTPIPSPADAEAAWWGLWPVTAAPGWAVVVGTVMVLAALVVGRRGSGVGDWGVGIGAAALFGAFFVFQVPHTRWGDAYILTYGISYADPALRLTHSWQAPLDLFLHSQVWLAVHDRFGWETARPVYQLLSPLAGGIYLAVAVALGRDRRNGPGWLTFGLLASIGVIQLFFGYVENYSFAAAGILLYLWLGLGVLRGERPLWLAATVLAVTNAVHPSTVIYAPSLLYLAWRVGKAKGKRQSAKGKRGGSLAAVLLSVALPMLIVAGTTVLLMESGGHGLSALLTSDRPGGGDGRWLVPLFATATRWEHYTMFSWGHLRDMFNEQMLVGPGILPGLLVLGGGLLFEKAKGKRQSAKGKRVAAERTRWADNHFQFSIFNFQFSNFLFLAAAFHLLLIWVWNPDYGGQRDWDLFALATIPSALLLAYALPRLLTERRHLFSAALPLLTIQTLHTAAWVYQNTLPWDWPT